MAVSSGFGQPEVEAELPKREQLPNDNYRANARQGQQRGPQLVVSRADAGLWFIFSLTCQKLRMRSSGLLQWRGSQSTLSFVGPRTKIAVDTLDRDVDPVGACIGGARIAFKWW